MKVKDLIDTPIDELKFSVIDTETTGMHPEFNRVMDIGIVTVKGGKIIDQWEALINPNQDVPYFITKYTRLRNSHVDNKPEFAHYSEHIKNKLANTIFVAHNVSFDYWFLYHEFKRLNQDLDLPKICTVLLGRKFLPELSNAHLDALSEYYGIEIEARHRALPDAKATALVLLEFLDIAKKKYKAKTYFDLEKLQRLKIKKEIYNMPNRLL